MRSTRPSNRPRPSTTGSAATRVCAGSSGGPPRYSRELGGFDAIVAVHRGLRITEEQRQRFIALFTAAFERVGHGDDPELRDAVLSCIEFGTEVAKVNSNARSDAELHPQRDMPQWHW